MALATTAEAAAPAVARRADWLFLSGAVIAAALLAALVVLDGQPASAALIGLGFALGIAFFRAEFSFTAAWRRLLTRGEAGGLVGAFLLIAVASLVIVPVAALVPGFGGAIAPIGPSLVVGAFVFGIGMQLANGCGSGTLYTVGSGAGRMLIALFFFVFGSVIGSLHLPAFLALGGIDPVVAANYLGPWGGLAATLLSLAVATAIVIAIARRRGANFMPSRMIVIGAVAIGLISAGVFLTAGHPWSVTFGFTVWGGKIASALGFDLSGSEFWQWPGPKRALAEFGLERHLEPHRFRHDLRRHGGGRGAQALRPHPVAPAALAARGGDRRPADGLGRAHRLRLQHRRVRRRHRVGLAARLDLVRRGARRLHHRHPVAAAVRPVARVTAMRLVYALVLIIGVTAVVFDHLTSPSSGRAVSPEDFAGACAPCGAPCPSTQKK